MQSNIHHILLLSFLSFFCLQVGYAQDIKTKGKIIPIVKSKKSTIKKDSLLLNKIIDTIKKDTIIKPKSSFKSKITHNAVDYIKQNAKKKTVELYNEAHVTYDGIDLKAGYILIDNKKNTLFAKGIVDSLGYLQRPVFKQDGQESEQDSIFYNFKTRKAIIYGMKSDQSGMITYATKTKRVNDSVIFLGDMRLQHLTNQTQIIIFKLERPN